MEWFFKPKVQLGLWANFIFVMFTLVSSSAGGHTYSTRVVVDTRNGYDAVESRSSGACTFDENQFHYVQLPPRLGPSQAVADHTRYEQKISVYTKQVLMLVKKDGRTLTLYPAFYVKGNSIIPPRVVVLRFRSDAPSRFYGDECELKIKAEGANYSAAVPVSHGTSWAGGAHAVESMTQDIPYPFFVKLVASKRVTFKVGDEEVTLTDEQLSALRDMQRCIQDSTCD